MKYLLLLSILFPSFLFSQTIQDLDKANGYKDLKFDMPFDLILQKTNAKKSEIQESPIISYDVKNTKYNKFGKFSAEIIIMENSWDSSLVEFFFKMDKHGRKEYLDLASFFIGLYGQPTTKDEANNTYKWRGAKVMIALSYSDELNRVDFNIMNLEEFRHNYSN